VNDDDFSALRTYFDQSGTRRAKPLSGGGGVSRAAASRKSLNRLPPACAKLIHVVAIPSSGGQCWPMFRNWRIQ
jgi:hypothetical protein